MFLFYNPFSILWILFISTFLPWISSTILEFLHLSSFFYNSWVFSLDFFCTILEFLHPSLKCLLHSWVSSPVSSVSSNFLERTSFFFPKTYLNFLIIPSTFFALLHPYLFFFTVLESPHLSLKFLLTSLSFLTCRLHFLHRLWVAAPACWVSSTHLPFFHFCCQFYYRLLHFPYLTRLLLLLSASYSI